MRRLLTGVERESPRHVIKLLHTADWHLGAALQGWTREPEQRAALTQIVDIARRREVDAIVVVGDVFDTHNPSADAQRLLFETLRDLRAACPHAAIALVAGNHDPASRLEAPRALFDLAGVVCVGTIARNAGGIDLNTHLTPLRERSGRTGAFLLSVPYPRFCDLPIADDDAAGSSVVCAVRALYAEMIGAAREKIGGAPLVVTGHLHIAGAIESEGAERRILVGGEHAAPCDIFPRDLAYVALGHLHRPQSVGRPTIRYTGSLAPMSKTEIDYAHGVALVTIGDDGATSIERETFARSVAHLRLPERGALPIGEIDNALAALNLDPAAPTDRRPFLHLSVLVEGPAVGLKAEIDAVVDNHPVRLVSLHVERPRRDDATAPEAALLRLSERDPADLFKEAFERAHQAPPTSEHLRLFAELAREE